MKQLFLWVAVSMVAFFAGCSDSTGSDDNGGDPAEYVIDTANVDYNGINRVVYYNFRTREKWEMPRSSWDIAVGDDLYVISNSGEYGSGVHVYATGDTTFSKDYSHMEGSDDFVPTYIDDNPLGHSWLDMTSMPPEFTREVFLIRSGDDAYYKIQFVNATMGGGVEMRIDSPDGDGGEVHTFGPANDREYTSIHLGDRRQVTAFPPHDEWHIRFGRTEWSMGDRIGGRSSIAINSSAGMEAVILPDTDIEEVTSVGSREFADDPLGIGHNWYTFDHDERVFSVDPATSLIRLPDNSVVKMQIHTFYGPGGEQFWCDFEYLFANEDGIFEQ
ncbi:HmuY family protein [Chitinivibrio alkaliphilus]|uniref:Uncharacterized protein n=1 Tax=Chitinivibrio alkaliphilus ACht1 TaxID=1313304 RepID=U7D9Y4_9BACT|nr:HmuY family protein [Chitinivibrio alkaliphilus]ERP31240.1 hypothetical protein CALK_1857 [Chitinivibrio alkaliphilus ACht1]